MTRTPRHLHAMPGSSGSFLKSHWLAHQFSTRWSISWSYRFRVRKWTQRLFATDKLKVRRTLFRETSWALTTKDALSCQAWQASLSATRWRKAANWKLGLLFNRAFSHWRAYYGPVRWSHGTATIAKQIGAWQFVWGVWPGPGYYCRLQCLFCASSIIQTTMITYSFHTRRLHWSPRSSPSFTG